MEKICSRCNRKLGFFEKMYEDNLCKECYKIIERKKEEEQRKKEEEQRKKEEEQRKKIATILLEQQKEEERKKKEELKQKEKLDAAKNFLLYTNYYWVVIGNISLIPFHYEDIFNKSITNKFEIIKLLFDEIIKELPKDYSFNDIKRNYSI